MKHGLNTDDIKSTTVDLMFSQITREIIGAAFEVHHILGYGFLEKRGITSLLEEKIRVRYKDVIVGDFAADLLVENEVLVEIKISSHYNSEDEAQLLNELKATGKKVGLLLNFGRAKVEFKRFVF